ncbi:MAG TPA: hypothetical protein VFK44_10985 [Bacillales bacterium]|nr:hypothetical protein [Bacillales bacterium]
MGDFGIKDVELERIVDRHVITEGNGVSMANLRKAFKIAIKENNKAIEAQVKKMIDEAMKQESSNS